MKENLRIVFMGTPDFARASLAKLVEENFNVVACFTNPDRRAGRGMEIAISPVKEYALKKNIDIYQFEKIKNNPEVVQVLKELKPDIIAVVAYGKILPKEVLEIPAIAPINVHGSLLPKYRGAAPMQWAIINGETKTGITTMFMDEGMDTGDMLLSREIDILPSDNFEDVHDKLKDIGASLLCETIEGFAKGEISRLKQPINGVTIAPMITKSMTKIDFAMTCECIVNLTRGLIPVMYPYIELDNSKKFKIYGFDAVKDTTIDPSIDVGDIIFLSREALHIRCADGYISIKRIKPENSKTMSIDAFLRGNAISLANKCI